MGVQFKRFLLSLRGVEDLLFVLAALSLSVVEASASASALAFLSARRGRCALTTGLSFVAQGSFRGMIEGY